MLALQPRVPVHLTVVQPELAAKVHKLSFQLVFSGYYLSRCDSVFILNCANLLNAYRKKPSEWH